jgi:hypothetical protein
MGETFNYAQEFRSLDLDAVRGRSFQNGNDDSMVGMPDVIQAGGSGGAMFANAQTAIGRQPKFRPWC